jgi:DNA-binding response OmpR family regulator
MTDPNFDGHVVAAGGVGDRAAGRRGRKVLVVEDEPAIAGAIVRGLKAAGYTVELACDGAAGLKLAERTRPDLVVLDLNLPELDGFDVLARLKPTASTPVLVVTARTGLKDRLRCFDLGAVDYLPKPFWMEELLARVKARLDPFAESAPRVVEWDDVRVDLDALEVTVGGQPAGLTRQEFAILAYLVERPGQAVPRHQMAALSDLAGEERHDRTIDSHVVRIRKKLGQAAWRIATVWGIGYRFERRDREREEAGAP